MQLCHNLNDSLSWWCLNRLIRWWRPVWATLCTFGKQIRPLNSLISFAGDWQWKETTYGPYLTLIPYWECFKVLFMLNDLTFSTVCWHVFAPVCLVLNMTTPDLTLPKWLRRGWKWPFALCILIRKQFSWTPSEQQHELLKRLSHSINSCNVKSCVFKSNMAFISLDYTRD